MTETMTALADIFGPPIYKYTRQQALADGFQVDVTTTASEAGIKFPVFLTRAVWDTYVVVPEGVTAQDERGRLWDIVWMTQFAIRRAQRVTDRDLEGRQEIQPAARLPVVLYVRNNNRKPKLIKLLAVCGPLDHDDPQPAITVSMTDED